MKAYMEAVSPDKISRLLNHGPVTLVSSRHGGVDNVMTVAWSCLLDFAPPKAMVVLGKGAKTRELIEKSGRFVIQVPTAAQVELAYKAGHTSLAKDPEKLAHCGITLFDMEGHDLPFVEGCAAWMACRLLPETRNQEVYDLFMAEIVGAWADTRVFSGGRWRFEEADPAWRSLHYVAGGRFYLTGEPLDTAEGMPE